ncbi:MAG: hypothetical protein MSK39_07140 [Dysosmobacter sp.]|nr:hypothetical protein [Dysosmobacter sp.]
MEPDVSITRTSSRGSGLISFSLAVTVILTSQVSALVRTAVLSISTSSLLTAAANAVVGRSVNIITIAIASDNIRFRVLVMLINLPFVFRLHA